MSIRQEMTNGIVWTAIAKYSGIIISLIISAILARLLSPDEFGIIAIATVSVNFLSIFSDIGLGTAVIQSNELKETDYNELFSLTIYIGLFISFLAFISSYFIASFYQNEELITICKILSINLLFVTLNILPNSLMVKNKRFKTIAKRTLFFQVLGGIIGVSLALLKFGALALVIPSTFASIGIFLFNFKQYPRKINFSLKLNSMKKIFSFSSYQFLFSFINYFSRNLDKMIIGKYLNMGLLGYYEKSYRLMMLPLENVTFVINPVLLPVLSSLQNNKTELAQKHEKLVSLISNVSFPIGILLHFTAYEVINLYYGNNWNAAVPVFSILSLSIPLQMILSTIGSIYQSAGNTKVMFFGGISNSFFTLSGFFVAAFFYRTIEAIAWSWVITISINFCISYILLYQSTLKTSIHIFIKKLKKPFINSFICFIVLEVYSTYFNITSNLWISFSSKMFLWLIITLALGHFTKQYNVFIVAQTLLNNIKNKIKL